MLPGAVAVLMQRVQSRVPFRTGDIGEVGNEPDDAAALKALA